MQDVGPEFKYWKIFGIFLGIALVPLLEKIGNFCSEIYDEIFGYPSLVREGSL